MIELYRKHRPSSFKQVVGQPDAVRILNGMVKENKVAHSILFTGPSGCGKTTLARILQSKLDCSDHDFIEFNCADTRGIDTIRDIRRSMGLSPLQGKSRIYLLDEVAKTSNDAQTALLKMLEDTPDHVYFLLATTDPNKLIKTIHTRCTEIKVHPLSQADMLTLLSSVCDKEGKKLSREVLDRIVECADGSARKALVMLGSVIDLENEDDQLSAILSKDAKKQAVDVFSKIVDGRNKWPDVVKVIKDVTEEPETIRRIILACAANILLSGKPSGKAFLIISAFEGSIFDTGKTGMASLLRACYEVVSGK